MPKTKHHNVTDIGIPGGDSLSRFATLIATTGERLAQLQNEAAEVALSEMSLRHQEFLKAMQRSAEMASWPHLSPIHGERMLSLVRDWLETVTELQAAWLETMVSYLPAGPVALVEAKFEDSPAFVERRVRSIVITFPDRRLAA